MATSFDSESAQAGRSGARALTDLAVRNLKAGESRTDGALPIGNGRLVISCTKARGQLRRVWTFRYRKANLRGEVKIGEYPALSRLNRHAPTLASCWSLFGKATIRRRRSPRPGLRTSKQPAKRRRSARSRALLDGYVANLKRAGKQSADDVEGIFRRHVKEPWPDLIKLPANRIAPETIRDILARLVRKGIRRQTNVLRSYLQAAFTHGAHSDLDPRRAAENAAVFKLTGNPVALLPRIGEFESTRDRVLNDAELRHLWTQLQYGQAEIAHTIRCQVFLGGQRFLQLLRATWDDYDVRGQTLRLADAKGRRNGAIPHLLPVPKRVAKLLKELRAVNGKGRYIFSTTAGAKPIHHTSLSPVFRQIGKSVPAKHRGGDKPFQGRNIRRSIETRLQALGVPREIRAQLLSHGRTSGVQQKHYERHEYLSEKLEALERLERHLRSVFESPVRRSEFQS